MRTTKTTDKNALQCWVSIVLALFAIAIPLEARAESPHYRIEFVAPNHLPYCKDPDGFRGILAMAQSRDLLESPASRILDVRVDKPNGGDYVVIIAIKELDGRSITTLRETYPQSMECFKVLHAAALTAALEIEKDLPAVEEPSPTAQQAPSPPTCAPQVPCPICDKPRAGSSRQPNTPRHWFVGLGGSTVLGAAPTTVVGPQFTVGWKWAQSWSLEGNVRGTFPATALPLETTPIRVHSILSLTIAPCYRLNAFGACLVGTGGNMWVEPITLTSARIGTSQYVGVGSRVFVDKHLAERWSMRVDAELIVPFVSNWIQDGPAPRWNSTRITGGAAVSFFGWF